MMYHNATVYFKSEDGEIPVGVSEVLEKYCASIVSSPKKENEDEYTFNVDLGPSTSFHATNFMKDCGKIEGVSSVASGSYTLSLVQRVIEFFKK